ncbi:8484_t:CDS:2 [Entrophospora sp. SA101]|nr:8484_t:CDS:2 [Entrophospora sp. SA101]
MEETEIVKDGEKSKGVICQVNISEVSDIIVHCNVVVRGGESTSNYIIHLLSAHGITKENFQNKLNNQFKDTSKTITKMFENHQPHTSQKQEQLEKALVFFIINDLQPLNILKSESFKNFIKLLDPRFTIPQSKKVKSWISNAYTNSLNKLNHDLSVAKYISCTTDLWTARNKQGYLGITCAWVDPDFNLNEKLLALKYIPSHTSLAISQKLIDIFSEFDINDKIISITTENGRNMVSAFKFLPNIARYGCSAHTIQLVIGKSLIPCQVFLARSKSAIGDVPTRWNSSYLAWERIYNLKDAIYTALNTILRNKKDSQSKKDYNRLKKIMLQEEEWDFMLEMIGVLGPFYEFTQILGASDYVTINLVYPLINTLKEECKNTTNNVYDYEVDFESTDDVFDVVYEEEGEENDDVGKIGKRKMKINQPQDMFGLTGAIKSLLYKYLNYYWKPPTAEELKYCKVTGNIQMM